MTAVAAKASFFTILSFLHKAGAATRPPIHARRRRLRRMDAPRVKPRSPALDGIGRNRASTRPARALRTESSAHEYESAASRRPRVRLDGMRNAAVRTSVPAGVEDGGGNAAMMQRRSLLAAAAAAP